MADCRDWNRLLSVLRFYDLIVKDEVGFVSVFMECEKCVKDSKSIAIEYDDAIGGWFYYRDWTSSGLPYLRDNESVYWSEFYFELLEDAKEFQSQYGGVGSWRDEYLNFVNECNKKRNGKVVYERP